MSENVLVSQLEGGWQVDVAGRERYVYSRLTDAIRRAGQVISSDASPGASTAVTWSFADDFMREALAVANERRALAAREAELTRRTNEAIVSLALEGLANGDIAAVLGLT
ncbi:hypothetical protein ACFVUP_39075, partial [Streptomyces bacillaris]|uniref:hypothetical protein n=1 Tax=Streptomyces bacillaris TaxID=68179 RepID=UPI0036DD8861